MAAVAIERGVEDLKKMGIELESLEGYDGPPFVVTNAMALAINHLCGAETLLNLILPFKGISPSSVTLRESSKCRRAIVALSSGFNRLKRGNKTTNANLFETLAMDHFVLEFYKDDRPLKRKGSPRLEKRKTEKEMPCESAPCNRDPGALAADQPSPPVMSVQSEVMEESPNEADHASTSSGPENSLKILTSKGRKRSCPQCKGNGLKMVQLLRIREKMLKWYKENLLAYARRDFRSRRLVAKKCADKRSLHRQLVQLQKQVETRNNWISPNEVSALLKERDNEIADLKIENGLFVAEKERLATELAYHQIRTGVLENEVNRLNSDKLSVSANTLPVQPSSASQLNFRNCVSELKRLGVPSGSVGRCVSSVARMLGKNDTSLPSLERFSSTQQSASAESSSFRRTQRLSSSPPGRGGHHPFSSKFSNKPRPQKGNSSLQYYAHV